jgi:hypothetical protein
MSGGFTTKARNKSPLDVIEIKTKAVPDWFLGKATATPNESKRYPQISSIPVSKIERRKEMFQALISNTIKNSPRGRSPLETLPS